MANNKSNNQHHVTKRPDGNWQVKRPGDSKPSVVKPTQGEAINAGRPISQNQGTELVIHRPNGQIRDSDSHGKDPNPPKDKK